MSETENTPNHPDTEEGAIVPTAPSEPSATGEGFARVKRFLPVALATALAALLALGLWLSYKPSPGQLQGMVDAREVRAASKVTGRIDAFHVSEGERVIAGQLLYTVDSPEVDARARQAGGALAAAQAAEAKARDGARPEDIRAAQAQWQRAKAAADLADVTYERLQRLHDDGVIAGQKRDEARANAVASREAERAARAQYDLALAGAREEDRLAASGQVEQARGAFAEVEAAAAETRVTAPVDGEVGRRLAQVGEIVPQGFPVFMITEISDPWVTVYVREDQFHGLEQGAVFRGKVPALGNRMAPFRVTFIAPAGEFATWRATRQSSGFDIKSFEVRLSPAEPVESLRPGMTVLFDWPQ